MLAAELLNRCVKSPLVNQTEVVSTVTSLFDGGTAKGCWKMLLTLQAGSADPAAGLEAVGGQISSGLVIEEAPSWALGSRFRPGSESRTEEHVRSSHLVLEYLGFILH